MERHVAVMDKGTTYPIVQKLNEPANWLSERRGQWKDAVSRYDRTPFEAASIIQELASALEDARAFTAAQIEQFQKVSAEVAALAGDGGDDDDAFLDVALTTLHRINAALKRIGKD